MSGYRIAVLASGRGSNLQALIDAIGAGHLDARLVGVFSDKPGSGAIAIAREHDLPAVALAPRDYGTRAAHDEALFSEIEGVQPDLIVCAGYMRIIGDAALRRFEERMINIHPSLLPTYPGLDTHARALAAGDAEHGASVHAVSPALDAGPLRQLLERSKRHEPVGLTLGGDRVAQTFSPEARGLWARLSGGLRAASPAPLLEVL